MFNIPEELKKLPTNPGCYLMHNAKDEIIYVGKAINLRNRVRQYFSASYVKSPKIEQMVSHIAYFEYIITNSELEALVLENNLIKKNRPRYNTMLRDDKTYPYICLTAGTDAFPRLMLVRHSKKDGNAYFGPFTSGTAVRDTIELLSKSCGLRLCDHKITNRPEGGDTDGNAADGKTVKRGAYDACLYYHIGQCPAPCIGGITKEAYAVNVSRALEYLEGNFGGIIRDLKARMQAASEAMEFEKAAGYRDMLMAVEHVAQHQTITSTDGANRDVIALAKDDRDAVVQVFFVRDGKIIGREHHYITTSVDDSRTQILENFIKQFYADNSMIPPEILVQYELDPAEAELIASWLTEKRHHRVSIKAPKRGHKEKLIELAYENASLTLEKNRENEKREEARTIGAVRELQAVFEGAAGRAGAQDVEQGAGAECGADAGRVIFPAGIRRIEAYDISHIQGTNPVGSQIVFEDGKAKKSAYRLYKIKTVDGPNDVASLKEVLARRLAHTEQPLPDLILMDGGQGQVNACLEVLKGAAVVVAGMVKDDHHRTRALLYDGRELPVDTHSEVFKLITRIQDEAHRFAIENHRRMRTKAQKKSFLDDIPGIGPTRRKAIMRAYPSLDALKAASAEELAALPGMTKPVAQSIYDMLH